MLLKGPQGPVFFAGPVGLYLIATRRWRDLITWPHAFGILVFALLWNAWQVPYFLAEGLAATRRIYGHDVALRFVDRSWTTLLAHVASYPFEVFACLLPWTPLLFVCGRGSFWNWLRDRRPYAIFLLCCLVATFPICWFVPGARGRYYMPLYPCCGVLCALAAEHCWQWAAKLAWQSAWRQLLVVTAGVMVTVGLGVPLLGLIPKAAAVAQPWVFAIPFTAGALGLAALAWWSAQGLTAAQQRAGSVAVASFVALAYVGLVINLRVQASNDTQRQIAELKRYMPTDAKLVSVGLVDHMFTFYFQEPIEPLPTDAAEDAWPADAEYFCFAPSKKGRPQFDFAWEQIAVVSCDRNVNQSERSVVVARRVGDRLATRGAGGTVQR
jgi:4-amino-4-deoxy-L-arabinose transferase-like glycosyltransferase